MSIEKECEFCHSIGPDGEVIPQYHPEHHSWTVVPAPQTGTTPFWPTTTTATTYTEMKQTPLLFSLDEKSLEAIRDIIRKEIQSALFAYPELGDDLHL